MDANMPDASLFREHADHKKTGFTVFDDKANASAMRYDFDKPMQAVDKLRNLQTVAYMNGDEENHAYVIASPKNWLQKYDLMYYRMQCTQDSLETLLEIDSDAN